MNEYRDRDCPFCPICEREGAPRAYPEHRHSATAEEKSVITEPEVIENVPLSALDRCDRCGAQARARASLPGGGELLFCGHHFRENADALYVAGAQIYLDE